jgi:hypothetical protein
MAKKAEEPTVLSVLQDLLVFQMACAGVPQAQIRTAVGLDMNRVNRIAKLAKKPKKGDE